MTDAVRKPNLFIIGAQKSGTTSLHGYLDAHPEISMSRIKEPCFFIEGPNLDKGEDWYLSLFDAEDRYRYLGESSTFYTKLPVFRGVPERIFRFNQEARLIYIMRNPFERTLSHYWHEVRNFYDGGEPLPLLRAVAERQRYLAFGDYAMQLEPYIKRFGRDFVFTLTLEALIRDPQGEVDRIYSWLGLQSHPVGEEAGKRYNQKPENFVGVAGAGALNRIRYSRVWGRVSPYIPQRLKWARLSPFVPHSLKDWAEKLAYKPICEADSEGDILLLWEKIGPIQRRQIERLSRLLGRDFPEWSESPTIRRLMAQKEAAVPPGTVG